MQENRINYDDVHAFIFNWKGQFENTCIIEEALSSFVKNVTVINSDENNSNAGWVDLDDSCYYGYQFRKALSLMSASEKVMFQIQGDTFCNDWKKVVDSFLQASVDIGWGVYCPLVLHSLHTIAEINMPRLDYRNFAFASNTDCTVWAIDQSILTAFHEMELDQYFNKSFWGWGFDYAICALSHMLGMPVVRDFSNLVNHPKSTNYNNDKAQAELMKIRSTLPNKIQVMINKMCVDPLSATSQSRNAFWTDREAAKKRAGEYNV